MPIFGRKKPFASSFNPKSKTFPPFLRFSGGSVSGRKTIVIPSAIAAMIEDAKKADPSDAFSPRRSVALIAHRLITGPITNPIPNAAPKNPKAFARSLGSVTSDTIAWATDTFPPVIPSKNRALNNTMQPIVTGMNAALLATKFAIIVPTKLITSSGFRPRRSESFPKIGVAKNWAALKVESNSPA